MSTYDMLGVGGRGTGIVQSQEIGSAVYKKLFWTSCRTSVPPVLGEGNLDGNSPLGECTDPDSDRASFRCLSRSSPVFKG